MFYEKQPKEQQDNYKQMLEIVGNLTLLFSESNSPYLPYRCHENIFCKYFEAVNLGRQDCSADAKKDRIGVGLKTWTGQDDQKVAEFGKLRPEYEHLTGIELVKKIAEYRNERIRVTKNLHGIDKMIYHIVKRVPGMMKILEHSFEYIDIDNIRVMEGRGNKNNTYFSDGHHTYHFSVSKNTLYMLFEDLIELDSLNVNILPDPYSYLMSLKMPSNKIIVEAGGRNPQFEYIIDTNKTIIGQLELRSKQLCLRLYSTSHDGTKYVPDKSGLNQWNASGRKRDDDELYIPYPADDRARKEDYFPPKDTPFELTLPDGTTISAKVCQGAFSKMPDERYELLSPEEKAEEDKRRQTGKAIMSNPNKLLGNWLLRKVFELPPQTIVTYGMLQKFGVDSVVFTKIEEGKYTVDFAEIGTYEKFYGEETPDTEEEE